MDTRARNPQSQVASALPLTAREESPRSCRAGRVARKNLPEFGRQASSFSTQREGEGPAMASPSPSSSSPAASPSGRKVRDVAADWHNAIAKWDRLVVDSGLALASRVANSRLAAPKEDDSAPTAEAASAAESTRSQELERDCDQLIEVWEKLRGLLQTMEKLTSTLQAVCDLEWYQNKQAWRPTPLFRSWPTTTFSTSGRRRRPSAWQGTARQEDTAARKRTASQLRSMASRSTMHVVHRREEGRGDALCRYK
ncbi:cyclin-dependent kinase 2-interacting protein isoform X2 [Petromyzon marinus]|uniref:Cyclin-dependent kinase 2-interacting protein isoform X2 n=1 Tax=Petromyzon marinus TaxID=7757 RepID=A0AAJ7U7W3_PETMA|nr:cyclin-dependent kinase 2-interacting protein isoform X2 [Petromyzon marinus]